MSMSVSRRGLMKALGAGAGAALGTRLAGPSWLSNASAANEKSALLVIFCPGGYNQMFTAADMCLGRFGVTSAEVETIGNGLAIHKPTFGTLSDFTKRHMAAIGAEVLAGGGEHNLSKTLQRVDAKGVPWTTRLAAALGGDAAIKAADLGGFSGVAKLPSVNGVPMQNITSLSALISQIPQVNAPPPPPDPTKPNRAIAAATNKRIQLMSKAQLDKNPESLLTLREGYNTAQALYERVQKPLDLTSIKEAYGVRGNERLSLSINSMGAKFAAAELLIRTGTNVVFTDAGEDYDEARKFNWTFDAHAPGGRDGLHERHLMGKMLPGLRTFTSRMLEDPNFNVVVAFIGDFCRTAGQASNGDPNANGHGNILSASVMGKYVKTGTTGRTYDSRPQFISLPDEKFVGDSIPGGIQQMWSYFAEILKVPSNPFGRNPHPLVA